MLRPPGRGVPGAGRIEAAVAAVAGRWPPATGWSEHAADGEWLAEAAHEGEDALTTELESGRRVDLYDTTLRDGSQRAGISLSSTTS